MPCVSIYIYDIPVYIYIKNKHVLNCILPIGNKYFWNIAWMTIFIYKYNYLSPIIIFQPL